MPVQMNTGETDNVKKPAAAKTLLRFPNGLLGFEGIKQFALVSVEDEQPFSWLQAVEDSTLAFLVIPPFPHFPDYEPDIPAEDAKALGLESPEDALLYNIVTLRSRDTATVNLKGPLVINRRSLEGKQVVLANAAKYSVQHPLPVEN